MDNSCPSMTMLVPASSSPTYVNLECRVDEESNSISLPYQFHFLLYMDLTCNSVRRRNDNNAQLPIKTKLKLSVTMTMRLVVRTHLVVAPKQKPPCPYYSFPFDKLFVSINFCSGVPLCNLYVITRLQ